MEYEYWLATVKGISDRKKKMLRTHMNSAKAVYYIEETELNTLAFLNENDRHTIIAAQKNHDIQREYEELLKKQIRLIPFHAADYPAKLHEITDKPYALYVKGNLPDESGRRVAIVGTRKCTPYGGNYACQYAETLARHGVEIISGMARGIDGIAQRGALMAGGRTFAVVGNGADICYPREHIGLYHDILECGGGIISELPPGTPPQGFHFPRRNRIISGLSDIVLVMEAREKSGSLITADMALEQGRDVYALPGPVDSALSMGCNRLIAQGAGVLLSPEYFLEELGMHDSVSDGKSVQKITETEKVLETKENMVYSLIRLYPKSVSELMDETELSAQEMMCILTSLQIQGYIREISKNYYIRPKYRTGETNRGES